MRRLSALFLGGIALALLYVPQAVVMFRTLPRKRHFWIDEPDSRVFMDILSKFFGKDRLLVSAFVVLTVLAAAVFLSARRRSVSKSTDDLLRVSVPCLLGVMLFGFLLPYVRSLVSTPMLIDRYEIILLPAVLTLMAVGVTTLRHRVLVAAVAAGLVFVSAFCLFVGKQYYTRVKKAQWREAAQHVIAASEAHHPGQRVLYYSSEHWRFRLYAELLGADLQVLPPRRADLERRLRETAEAIDGVWVLRAHDKEESTSFHSLLTNHFASVHRREWRGAKAELYVPRPVVSPATGRGSGT